MALARHLSEYLYFEALSLPGPAHIIVTIEDVFYTKPIFSHIIQRARAMSYCMKSFPLSAKHSYAAS